MGYFPPQAVSFYTNFAAFPSASIDGALALALDTDDLYAYNLATTTWKTIGGPGIALSLGALDGGSASATLGASIVAGVLYMQSASVTVPGLVNTAAQAFAGVKTLTSPIFITPALGTPASGILTSCTGLPISTGVSGLGTGVATFLTTPSSANLAAAVTDETGSGALVFATSPTFVTPILGIPTSGTLTNCTGYPVSGITGLGTGVATFLATPSSANLAAALTDKTGTGVNVFATSPTLVTPVLGTPSSGTLTSCTGLPISSGVSGLGTGVATFLATPSSANLLSAMTTSTGSGNLCFATSPTLVTPVLGTPSSGTLTSCTGLPISSGVSGLGSGVATFLATPSSANLLSAMTTSTGSGNLAFATSPTLVTPILGTPTSGTLTNCTGYPVVVPGTSNGLVSSSGVTGASGTGAIGAGFVGELVTSSAASATAMSSSAYVTGTSQTLTAGVWLISGMAYELNTTVNVGKVYISVAQNSGSYTDIIQNSVYSAAGTTGNGVNSNVVVVVSLSGTSAQRTVAVRCQATSTVTGTFSSIMTCVRIA